jgi:hypothetical protein
VLAPAGPHDENLHAVSVSKGSEARIFPFVIEPGLDRHEWETEWQGLEPLIVDSPSEALPEVDGLIERMMQERGLPTEEPAALESAEPEIVAEFLEARRITNLVERGESVDPGDIGAAVTGYRNLYEYLIAERRAP